VAADWKGGRSGSTLYHLVEANLVASTIVLAARADRLRIRLVLDDARRPVDEGASYIDRRRAGPASMRSAHTWAGW
jgi:hypothetical protein